MSPDLDLLARLALSLGIGLLIGFERGWQRRGEAAGARATGIRTFILIGLFGGIAAAVGKAVSDVILAAAFISLAIVIATIYVTGVQRGGGRGATTEIAALSTFALGALAVRGDMIVAAATAVVLTAVLDLKRPLHRLLKGVSSVEMGAGLKLLIISIVLLPVLPDRGYGPGGVLNPYELWWIVVLIAGITFGGYLALRLTGPGTGAILMGLIGGLASSTAVTVSAARLTRAGPTQARRFAGAIAAATAVMFIRTLIVAAVLYPALAIPLGAPLVFAAIASAGAAWLLGRSDTASPGENASPEPTTAKLHLETPDDIGTAIKFGVALAAITLLVYYARQFLGDSGLYATAAISGLIDVDAITVSAARMASAGHSVTVETTSIAILIAVAVNTLVKVGITQAFGSTRLALLVLALTGVCLVAALCGFLLGELIELPTELN